MARRRTLVLLCTLAILAISVAGFEYYDSESARIRGEKADELRAISSLKIAQITRWRFERVEDARILGESQLFHSAFLRWRKDREFDRELRQVLRLHCIAGPYSKALLADTTGVVLMSTEPAPDKVEASTAQVIRLVLDRRAPVIGELYRSRKGPVQLDIAVPVASQAETPAAVLVLTTGATDFLFPMIQSWPTPSRTAETLLVRRDGDSVLFMNNLRHKANTALALHEPLTDANLPAVLAVEGVTGSFLGRDYRGMKVLADLAHIPGSLWYLVAKVDTDEILSELHYRAMVTLLMAIALSVSVTGTAAYSYRSRQAEERKRTAEILRASQCDLAEAQRIANIGSWIWNMETDTAKWSEEAFRIFGIAPRDLQHHHVGFLSLIHPDDRERVRQARMDALSGVAPYDLHYRIPLANGTERIAHALAEVERDASGKAVRVRGTVQDVTERQRMEEALQQRNEELIRFTYTVSHDLKSPLVTIRTFLGYLETDLERGDAVRVQTDLGHMRRAAEKMAEMLDELLELSRVGRKMNPSEDIPLQNLVAEALELVSGRIEQTRTQLAITQTPLLLHGDHIRLREVFQNLIDNAAKFMGDQPEPKIEIGMEQTDSEIVIFVRDNGVGIDPRHQHKLFGLFEKLLPNTEGTGIGLALIKRIVEVHGGRIWAESAGLGHGATFRITLPNTKILQGDICI